jgi:transketolase
MSSTRKAFGETILKLAKNNKNLYVVNADLKSPLYLNKFAKKYPNRFIECGIAEANAAAVAAGLAKTGKTVFLVSFACFSPSLNWGVIRQSICYNNANVKIIGSHAGLASTDLGATHQMLEDIALTSCLPNMEVFAPVDDIETEKIITAVSRTRKPAYVRLTRADSPTIFDKKNSFTVGKSNILTKGNDITIVSYGLTVNQALMVQAKLDIEKGKSSPSIEIINCSSIKPMDTNLIIKSVKKTGKMICIEDHQKNGGLGQKISSVLAESGIPFKFIHLAINDRFGRSGKNLQELYDYYGIGVNDLIKSIDVLLNEDKSLTKRKLLSVKKS